MLPSWKLLFTIRKVHPRYVENWDFPGGVRFMVKAVFHKNQKVFVAPVGTWATVERVIPHWVKGIDEPLRVHYDCGLGREFDAAELSPERPTPNALDCATENWGVFRRQNRWQSAEDSAGHPAPGSHPVVVTADDARGGWRVPAAEYALAPERYEAQARVIAAAPRLMRIAKLLVEMTSEYEDELPQALHEQAQSAARILSEIQNSAASLSQALLIEEPDLAAPALTAAPQVPSMTVMKAAAAPAPRPQPIAEKTFGPAAAQSFGKQEQRPGEAFTSPPLRRPQAPR
jgi:hypothetical protein